MQSEDLWLQILADVLGEELTLPDNSEGAAFGASVLGFIASGRLKGIGDTAQLVHPRRKYSPIAENVEVYRRLYDIFDTLYWKLQPDFAGIAAYQKDMQK